MEDAKTMQRGFTGYEYKEVTAESSRASFLIDGYECFGWELDENFPESRKTGNAGNLKKMVIRLKRSRKIVNKMELTRLQRNFEACVNEIDTLEKAKTSTAALCAITVGIIGTAFMAGSVFAVTAEPPRIILSVILAVPAFLGWIIPYFLYKRMVRKQTEKLTPLIEEKQEEIYGICEKGSKLLY